MPITGFETTLKLKLNRCTDCNREGVFFSQSVRRLCYGGFLRQFIQEATGWLESGCENKPCWHPIS